MNKEFAWFLGTLASDGSITRPKSRENEVHIQYCIHIKDVEVLHKIKKILNTRAKVHEYPNYKSPQCKLRVYDRKDIIKDYSDIKTKIPETIKGYERHYMRGLVDGDGCISYRKARNTLMFNFINQEKNIVIWFTKMLSKELQIPYKEPRYISKDHIYSITYEGRIAKLIVWWLYHGDISSCVLERKYNLYKQYVLNNNTFSNYDSELLYSCEFSYLDKFNLVPNVNASKTLEWCKRVKKLLTFNTVPVFHNKGKIKYYQLYIPTK